MFLQLFLAVLLICSFTDSTVSCRPEKCCHSWFVKRQDYLCASKISKIVMLLVCDSCSSDFLRQWTTAYNCCVAAGTRFNPMPTLLSFAQVVAGASIQGPLGMRLCDLGLGRARIPNLDGHITPGCSRVNIWPNLMCTYILC